MSDQPSASSSTTPASELAELSIAGSSSAPAPPAAQPDDAYNGDLPDFSDDEAQPEASSSTAKPRRLIGSGGGRKLISKLKGRAPPPGGAKPKPSPAKLAKTKAAPAAAQQQVAVTGGEDDEEEGTLEMNEEMLAMVMEQLQQQGASGTLTKEKVQAMVMGKSSTSEGKKLAKDME